MPEVKNYADPPEEGKDAGLGERFVGMKRGRGKDEEPDPPAFDEVDYYDDDDDSDKDDGGRLDYSDRDADAIRRRAARPSPGMGTGPAFVIAWIVVGLFMSVMGFVPMALLGHGTEWMKKAALFVAIGVLLSIAISTMLYLFVWPNLMVGWAEEIVEANQFSVVYAE